MGKGSIANLASAVTVAASSFDMAVTDPRPLLALIDRVRTTSRMQQQRTREPIGTA
jgi:homoaconitate hydratase